MFRYKREFKRVYFFLSIIFSETNITIRTCAKLDLGDDLFCKNKNPVPFGFARGKRKTPWPKTTADTGDR